MQGEAHQIPASKMWISRGPYQSCRASLVSVSRMRCSAKRCAADPGSLWTRRSLRSRVCSASFRFAACCAAPGKHAPRFTRLRFPDAVQREAVHR